VQQGDARARTHTQKKREIAADELIVYMMPPILLADLPAIVPATAN